MSPRPRNVDPSETRARILAAATDAFAERGVAGASTREIARAAGVSLATVHHHFDGKQGLYDACVLAMYAEFEGLRQVLAEARGADRQAWLADVVRRTWRFARRHQTAVRLTTMDTLSQGTPTSQRQLMDVALQAGAAALRDVPLEPSELRLCLRSVSWLVIRYTLASEEDLAQLVGDPSLRGDALHDRIGDHLARAAVALVTP